MDGALLRDAFGHHAWASLTLLDVCRSLTPEQLETTVPGTYGSILATLRHLVRADGSYLVALTAGRVPPMGEDAMDLDELRVAMETFGSEWRRLLESDLDPAAVVVRHRADGSESHAPLTIRLAQALHHGTDHRSQVCTALTTLGIEPPAIGVWDFARSEGRLSEVRRA